jgi:hypothetical protein
MYETIGLGEAARRWDSGLFIAARTALRFLGTVVCLVAVAFNTYSTQAWTDTYQFRMHLTPSASNQPSPIQFATVVSKPGDFRGTVDHD